MFRARKTRYFGQAIALVLATSASVGVAIALNDLPQQPVKAVVETTTPAIAETARKPARMVKIHGFDSNCAHVQFVRGQNGQPDEARCLRKY